MNERLVDQRTLELIQGSYQAIESGREKELVLTLGESGVGKSTLVNYLNGALYRLRGTWGYNASTQLISGNEVARVGHDPANSETLYPQIIKVSQENQSLFLADLAGLNGTREAAVELAGTLSAHLLAKMANRIKAILFVIDINSLNAGRGGNFRKTIQMLNKILQGNFEGEAANAVHFVITKIPPGVSVDAVISTYISPLYDQLDSIVQSSSITEEDEMVHNTLDLMLRSRQKIFVPNVFDEGQTGRVIFRSLFCTRAFQSNALNLLNIDRHQENFLTVLNNMANDYSQAARHFRHVLPLRVAGFNQSITTFNHQIKLLRSEVTSLTHAMENGLTPERIAEMLRGKKSSGREIETQLNQKRRLRTQLLSQLETHKNEILLLDSDEPMEHGNYHFTHAAEVRVVRGAKPHWIKRIFGAQAGWNVERMPGEDHYEFQNDICPAPGVICDISCTNQGGSWGQPRFNGNLFKINFNYALGDSVHAHVAIKIAKRDIPANKAKLDAHRQAVEENKRLISGLDREISVLADQETRLLKEIECLQTQRMDVAVDRERLRHQVNEREQRIAEIEQLKLQSEQNREAVRIEYDEKSKALTQRRPIFNTLMKIIQLLALDKTDELFEEFISAFQRNTESQSLVEESSFSPKFFHRSMMQGEAVSYKAVVNQNGKSY